RPSLPPPPMHTPRRSPPPSVFFSSSPRPPRSTLFPYTTLFRSDPLDVPRHPAQEVAECPVVEMSQDAPADVGRGLALARLRHGRSEEHTSELQSLTNLVCRLLLEKKNITTTT